MIEERILCRVKKWNAFQLNQVCRILYLAGKDMAAKYQLNHWNNSYVKDMLIVMLCVLKNEVYVVYERKIPVATFQIHIQEEELRFMKLATNPQYMGKGIGSFCLEAIEQLARNQACKRIICEVYEKSLHAKEFYEHKNYTVFDTIATLKYTELKMKKELI